MLWLNFILCLNFIFLYFKLIAINYHNQKQRKIKSKPRIELNYNTQRIGAVYIVGCQVNVPSLQISVITETRHTFKKAVPGIRQVGRAVEALWVTELKRQGTTYGNCHFSGKGQGQCLGKVKNKCKRVGLKVIKNVHTRLQFLPFTVIAMSSMLLLCDLTFDAWCRNITSCSKLRLLAGGLGVDSPEENLVPASTSKKQFSLNYMKIHVHVLITQMYWYYSTPFCIRQILVCVNS